jgi:hypothetical protein
MTRIQYWLVTVIAVLCFVAMAANITLGLTNGALRGGVSERQQFVQQSVQLEGLYKEIVRALAELGARNNDNDVKAMLQKHGITYNVNAPQGVAPAPARK